VGPTGCTSESPLSIFEGGGGVGKGSGREGGCFGSVSQLLPNAFSIGACMYMQSRIMAIMVAHMSQAMAMRGVVLEHEGTYRMWQWMRE